MKARGNGMLRLSIYAGVLVWHEGGRGSKKVFRYHRDGDRQGEAQPRTGGQKPKARAALHNMMHAAASFGRLACGIPHAAVKTRPVGVMVPPTGSGVQDRPAVRSLRGADMRRHTPLIVGRRRASTSSCRFILFRRIREELIRNHVEGPKGFRALLAPWTAAGFAGIVGDDEIRFPDPNNR
jgi:hypothetical protein